MTYQRIIKLRASNKLILNSKEYSKNEFRKHTQTIYVRELSHVLYIE